MNGKIYYEISTNVYLINDIHCHDVYEKLSKLINFSFYKSQFLSCLHNRTGFKHYSFSALYPIEIDRTYKANEIYTYLLRTYDLQIAKEYVSYVKNIKNEDFVVTEVVLKTWEHKDIEFVDNLTPTIITLKDGMRWNKDAYGLDIAKESIFKNLINKYNSLNDTKFEFRYEDIIKDIIFKSDKCAIVINYKGIKLLSYKFRVEFQKNNIAQEIANLAVVEGIGEKNSSLGMGFVKPYFRKGVKGC